MSLFDDKSLNKREYIEGVNIFESGGTSSEAYLIEAGKVDIYREEDGTRHEIASLGPGDIFGEMALIRKQPHTSFAVAAEKTLVVIITQDMIDEKLESTDPLIKALVHLFIKRLYRSNDEKQGRAA